MTAHNPSSTNNSYLYGNYELLRSGDDKSNIVVCVCVQTPTPRRNDKWEQWAMWYKTQNTQMGTMWHKTQNDRNLFGGGNFIPYPVPPAHAPASVINWPFSALTPYVDLVPASRLKSCVYRAVWTISLTSIDNPQIGGKFTATPGELTNLFYGCKD